MALLALLVAQWTLSSAVHGTNYDGGDGKMAQATVLAAVKFSRPFEAAIISPIQGLGSQLLPLNVWANPAYWPFHFLDKAVATDVSALIALMVFATASYVMARCFDVGVVASAIGAQAVIILFAPMVLMLQLATVFCINPGNAVAYAPHMVALGLLARLEPGSWRRIGLITTGLLALSFYSLYSEPMWAVVAGLGWSVAFAVVVLSPLRLRTIALRCAALGASAIVLFLSGALEYVRTLSQYTARYQFPAVGDRPHSIAYVSTLFSSPHTKYIYVACAFGWLLGIAASRGRPRVLCIAAAVSFLGQGAYSAAFLLLPSVPWTAPIPYYVEQCLLSLYLAAGAAGWLRLAAALAPLGRRLGRRAVSKTAPAWLRAARSRAGWVPVLASLVAVAIVPARLVTFARTGSAPYAEQFNEPWPEEPEVVEFFTSRVGRAIGQPIRGSLHFWNFSPDTHFTMISVWANAVHTVDEYSQLVTPQALYALPALLQTNVTGMLNGFVPFPGTSWDMFFKTLRLFGVRYYLADPISARAADQAGYPAITLPRRPIVGQAGLWQVYELPRPNVGDYSPTEVVTATSAPEMAAAMRAPNFDFTRQVVLSATPREPLVPARGVRLSPSHGGLHLTARSDGPSLVVLPLQFSHCLRPRDARVRLVRADLLLTGAMFSGAVDTDIVFDYGIFRPACRRADLADMRGLRVAVESRQPHLAGGRTLPGWGAAWATLRAAARSIK